MEKIIIFYPHIQAFGGIERNIVSVIKEIERLKKKHVLICFEDKIHIKRFYNKINRKVLKGNNLFTKILALKKFIKTNDCNGDALMWGEKAAMFAYLSSMKNYSIYYPDPPMLYQENNTSKSLDIFKNIRRWISMQVAKQGLKYANLRFTTTKKNKKDLERLYNTNFKVIYEGGYKVLKNTKYPIKKIFNRNKINLLTVGRLSPNRNIEWLIDFFSFLKEKKLTNIYNNSTLIICGKGEQFLMLKSKVDLLNLKKKITFKEFVSDKMLNKIYLKTDLTLIPAIQGYGLPALESLYYNIPVVLNKNSRISEIFTNNPWVKITKNDKKDFFKKTILAISYFKRITPNYKYLLKLPTHQRWANQIGNLHGWW